MKKDPMGQIEIKFKGLMTKRAQARIEYEHPLKNYKLCLRTSPNSQGPGAEWHGTNRAARPGPPAQLISAHPKSSTAGSSYSF